MDDLIKLFTELKGVVGGVLAVAMSIVIWMWRERSQREMTGADASGQIKALAVYEGLLKAEREARMSADQRVDQFAKERNDAYQQVWELKGQLKGALEQLEGQNRELMLSQERIRFLEGRFKENP
ncbi:hypothetical protein [Burkholderia sp. TSV86]|uniref:hypothetical protein n=1 Tax=Burkholderia sp. TSV86 TaxID=1385594 RepID=UPI000753A605|nr:hypothetical protein [Burkholderia sp. TSV86]KVE36374.1 hypothetical protein WS68_00020 [Burkholderia sp. TSV86]